MLAMLLFSTDALASNPTVKPDSVCCGGKACLREDMADRVKDCNAHGLSDKKSSLFADLDLTEEQQQKIDELQAASFSRRAGGERPDQDQRRVARQEFDKALEEILTPDQYAKYIERRKAVDEKIDRMGAAKKVHLDQVKEMRKAFPAAGNVK